MARSRPLASDVLELRADVLTRIRAFLATAGVCEVETPALSVAAATDPHIDSFTVANGEDRRYLHTSPEFAMKRLLAAGSGDIYQICKVFRAGESGAAHNSEFTLLEWYRLGIDHHALMDETIALIDAAIASRKPLKDARKLSYRDAFVAFAGLDPFTATADELANRALAAGLQVNGELRRDDWLDLLMSQVVSRQFSTDCLTVVFDYPPSQAALARVRRGEPDVAERFEIFWGDLELANGFHELTDAREQRWRFEAENARREAQGHPQMPIDERLLDALEAGLPPCAGVALGVDRLLMLARGARRIDEVLSFPWDDA